MGALEDPEDALHWMVDLMDATLQRVDKAVDEGHKVVENYKKVNFQPHQVRSSLTVWLCALLYLASYTCNTCLLVSLFSP